MKPTNDTIPYGFCQCGCGRKTSISKYSNPANGIVKGQPVKFVVGHKPKRYSSPVSEDHGYETPCLIFQGRKTALGYGSVIVDKRVRHAHTAAWEKVHGPITKGIEVHHKCSKRDCVNVDHLEALTKVEHRMKHGKLSHSDIIEIRSSPLSKAELSRKFGVCDTHIGRIIAGLKCKEYGRDGAR